MGDCIFPDGTKLSELANKPSSTPQIFSADVVVDKTTGVVKFVLMENGTPKGSLSWDITNGKTVLESLGDLELKVGTGKKVKVIVG